MSKETVKQDVSTKQKMPTKQSVSTKQNMSQKQHVSMGRLRKCFIIGRGLISSLLFPKRCPVCDEILTPEETEKGIHLACENKLYPVEGAVCMHCGRPLGQLNPRKWQQKKTPFEQEVRNENHDEGFYFDRIIPSHLSAESTYEYCQECRRKGYAPKHNDIVYRGHDTVGRFGTYHNDGIRRTDSTHHNIGMYRNYEIPLACGSYITQAKSLYVYRGAIKNTMYRLKYANKREYAAFFAKKAVERYPNWFALEPTAKQSSAAQMSFINSSSSPDYNETATALHFDVIIPVPMYLPKQKQRGYNQAETFATELSHLTGIPVDKACIKRVKDTTPQKNLNDIQRKNNLENAFQITKSIVQYKHILVVDDIYTTGHTAEAVAKELQKQGECQIYLLSICIGAVN